MKIKDSLEDKQWADSSWLKLLRARNQYSGPSYEWVGVTEHGWGKCIHVNSGERLVFGLPFATCIQGMCDELGGHEQIGDINHVASYFVSLPQKALVDFGGFYIYLRAGQGIVIPPLYMVGMLNAFNLMTGPNPEPCTTTADVVEPCLGLV